MYLWDCYAVSVDYDPTGLVVARDEEAAIEKFKNQLAEAHIWHGSVSAEKVDEIGGYKITLTKVK
ncbi:hypothetical protein [Siminovitchia fordii]|uniref:Phage protein n=1 Tax=Siminovitchia fordii TaxID=254759 RepID=A0ABQ4KC10_9BACI|nr:hypothetical protein [Siminovitchia fordii]GIN22562.1 hypothetical protein J1TS3_36960 [Siminovitchia fordii]